MSIGGVITTSNHLYAPEFKDEAVHQVLERGYSVAEVGERLGVSAHSLHKWVKAAKPDKEDELGVELKEAKREILGLHAALRRTEENRDIVKKAARYLASQPEWSTVLSKSKASSIPLDARIVGNTQISRCRAARCWSLVMLLFLPAFVWYV